MIAEIKGKIRNVSLFTIFMIKSVTTNLNHADIRSKIENLGFASATHEVFRCPVTQEPLSFAEFESEVKEPEHGKSNFQIGHMNPLKAASRDPHSGHTAQNISWVSSDGNRIQGHLSIVETRALIRRIYENYKEFGIE